ncbi:hypothetical protein [Streptomyces scopuliridis]|uniref:Uncharacterized protein n=1 Tax=Streptomyces scopuliridis TaxID=452529 RepID=A0ACD4ZSY0_9ACTN|nr:hypothetical protein [Streptomyces scopuliridis]WSC01266.1 hypothetical protein OG835_32570 [Streptomyces scopuliridis]
MSPITLPAGDIAENDILCDDAGRPYALVATVIGDDDAGVWVSAYTLDEANPTWFPVKFEPGETAVVQREALARTGRPSRSPARVAGATAFVATAMALSVVLAQPDGGESAPVPSASSTRALPTPETSRSSSLTDRHGVRARLSREEIAKPATTPTAKNPIPVPPADIRIVFYEDCTGHAQSCIDDGQLTMYAGRILAGHNYMGYQWLSRVPVGRTVRVISGPLAGTYRVYGHMRLSRQGGAIPSFGSAELVFQTCEGAGTGFSLLKRI